MTHEVTPEDLERLAEAMAKAIPDLECPECCEIRWTFHYIERSAELYREELEWACLVNALVRYRTDKKG